MKVTVARTEFVRELELLEKAVSRKPSIPVLAHVLVQADDKGLRLATTDLEIGLVTFCPATVEVQGTTTLPVKHLLDLTRLLDAPTVSLTLEGRGVRVESGSHRSKVPVLPAQDFPVLPSMAGLTTQTLGVADVLTAIKKVRFAIPGNNKSKKYALDGALVEFDGDAARFVTTDTHRLAFVKIPAPASEVSQAIFPSKTLDSLVDLLGGASGDLLYASTERHLFFVVDGRMMFSRVIEGKFPAYERIIPNDYTLRVTLDKGRLRESIKRVVLTSDELQFVITTNLLTITTKHAELGEALEQLDIRHEGADVTLRLNGAYLLDFLDALSGDVFSFSWKNASGAILMTEAPAYAYVQSPIR